MLRGEGNEHGEKTTIGLISKNNNFARAAHFFVHFFAVVLHDYNVKLPETSCCTFYEGNVVPVLVQFFHSPIFTLVVARTSHFLTAAKKVSSNKWLLIFRSSSLSLFFSLSFAGLSPSLFFLYIPNLWT